MSEHNGDGGGDTNRRGNNKKGKKNRKHRNGLKNTNKNFNQRAAHSDQKQDNSGDGRNSHVKDLSSGLSDSQIKKSSEPNASPNEPYYNPSNYESRDVSKLLFGFDPSVHQPLPIDDTIKEKSTMKKSKLKGEQSEETSKPAVETVETKEKQSLTEFRQKLISIHEKGLSGTFIFKVGSQKVKVSEMFFADQSEVFADLMLSKKDGSKNNEACFDNLSFGAVQQFVNFIHLKSTENLGRYVEDVLKLADEYDVMELKNICVQHLKSRQLNDDNILQILFIAFKRQDEELKKKALDYLAQSTDNQKFISIMLSEDWFKVQLENPHLAREIMSAVLIK